MKQIVTHGGRNYRAEGYTYRVADRFPDVADGDLSWWEYQIEESVAQALADFTENKTELGEILDNPVRQK